MNIKEIKECVSHINKDAAQLEAILSGTPITKNKEIIDILNNVIGSCYKAINAANENIRGGNIIVCDKCGGVDTVRKDGFCPRCGNTSFEIEVRD